MTDEKVTLNDMKTGGMNQLKDIIDQSMKDVKVEKSPKEMADILDSIAVKVDKKAEPLPKKAEGIKVEAADAKETAEAIKNEYKDPDLENAKQPEVIEINDLDDADDEDAVEVVNDSLDKEASDDVIEANEDSDEGSWDEIVDDSNPEVDEDPDVASIEAAAKELDEEAKGSDTQYQKDWAREYEDKILKSEKIDDDCLKGFTIAKKALSVNAILKDSIKSEKKANQPTATWVEIFGKDIVEMTPFSYEDIMKLQANPDLSPIKRLDSQLSTLYKHITNTKQGFEAWLKTTQYNDLFSLYFCALLATFGSSYHYAYRCTNESCRRGFINEYKVMDLLKFKNDDAKKKVLSAYNEHKYLYDVSPAKIIPVSDKYAAAIQHPTIYSGLYEQMLLNEAARTKFSTILGVMRHVTQFYYINNQTNQLVPISNNVDPNNRIKTLKNKIIVYSKILNKLGVDEYAHLIKEINKMTTSVSKLDFMDYIIPEAKCPYCGTVIKETTSDPLTLLFSRHQLSLIPSIILS